MEMTTFIICDDIRNEIGNKHSLIGIYDDSINFAVPISEKGVWPKAIKMGIFIKLRFGTSEEIMSLGRFRLESILNNKETILADGNVKIDEKKDAKGLNIAIVFGQFIFENIGELKIRLSLFDKSNKVMQVFESPEPLEIIETVV